MFTISKQFHFSASHQLLGLINDHPCSRLHGHNYVVEVELRAEQLNQYGFVRDFHDLGELKIFVDEIFGPTLQGEGPMVGLPVVFVRTGGCDYRCHWCDTLHAVLPKYHLAFVAELRERHSELPLTLQPVNAGAQSGELQDDSHALHGKLMEQMRWLHEQIVELRWYNVRVLPQLHVMIWGTGRGV